MIKLTLNDLIESANKFGGKCLSKTYINSNTKLEWECQYGHRWFAVPYSIRRGCWCKQCHIDKTKTTLEEAQKLACIKNGKCLGRKLNKFVWECELGHQWEARFFNIKIGNWCPECISFNPTIENIQKLAVERNGKCLSSVYINSTNKLQWMCKKGHVWNALLGSIKSAKSWCPECSSSFGERICRQYLEELFGKKFIKIRPKWLLNDEDNKNTTWHNRLELDGYCAELNLAFEYYGNQHYYFNNKFIKTQKDLDKLRKRDLYKLRLCDKNNVTVIIIPQFKIKNLFDLIKTSIIYNHKLEVYEQYLINQPQIDDVYKWIK